MKTMYFVCGFTDTIKAVDVVHSSTAYITIKGGETTARKNSLGQYFEKRDDAISHLIKRAADEYAEAQRRVVRASDRLLAARAIYTSSSQKEQTP